MYLFHKPEPLPSPRNFIFSNVQVAKASVSAQQLLSGLCTCLLPVLFMAIGSSICDAKMYDRFECLALHACNCVA